MGAPSGRAVVWQVPRRWSSALLWTCQGRHGGRQDQEVHPTRPHQAAELGVVGTRTAEFCSEHPKDGKMVDVRSKRCTHMAAPSGRAMMWQAPRRQSSVLDTLRRGWWTSIGRGARTVTAPSKWRHFGVAGAKTAEFCSRHAKDGIMRVTTTSHNLCGVRGSSGGARGFGSVVMDRCTARRAGTGLKIGGCSPSPKETRTYGGRSRAGRKRPRQAPFGAPSTPMLMEPTTGQSHTLVEHEALLESGDAVVKTEVAESPKGDLARAFPVEGDAGGWFTPTERCFVC